MSSLLIGIGFLTELISAFLVVILWFPLRKSGLVNSLLWILASEVVGRFLSSVLTGIFGASSTVDVINEQAPLFVLYFASTSLLLAGLKNLLSITLVISNAGFLLDKIGTKTRIVALLAKAYRFDLPMGITLIALTVIPEAIVLYLLIAGH